MSRGNVLNWPIPPRSDAKGHASAVRQTLDRLVEFDLDVVLVSAGFDAYARDPVTELTLEQRKSQERFGLPDFRANHPLFGLPRSEPEQLIS